MEVVKLDLKEVEWDHLECGTVVIANVLSHLSRECLVTYCREIDRGRSESLL